MDRMNGITAYNISVGSEHLVITVMQEPSAVKHCSGEGKDV